MSLAPYLLKFRTLNEMRCCQSFEKFMGEKESQYEPGMEHRVHNEATSQCDTE